MAVENKYIDVKQAAGELMPANINGGSAQLTPIIKTFEVAASDDDGSKYRLFTVNSQNIFYQLHLVHDGITGGTDYDVGIYDTLDNGGDAVDADVLADGMSLATATSANAYKDALVSVDKANLNKSVAELLGLARDPNKQYDVVLTANTVGTAAGTVTVKALIA